MKTKQTRSLNYKNCYILFISLVALISLTGNVWQNYFFTSAIHKQEALISSYEEDAYEMMIEYYEDNEQLQLNK